MMLQIMIINLLLGSSEIDLHDLTFLPYYSMIFTFFEATKLPMFAEGTIHFNSKL